MVAKNKVKFGNAMRRFVVCLVSAGVFFLSACTDPKDDHILRVAVTADARLVLEVLTDSFSLQSGYPVEMEVGASGQLKTRIAGGGAFDVYLSADTIYPKALSAEGAADSVRIYAYGALAIWTMLPLNIHKELALVLDPDVHKIGIPDPEGSPYGAHTVDMLKSTFLWDKMAEKVVFGKSVAQIGDWVASGTCDLGFVSKSVVLSPEMKGKGNWVEVSPRYYQPIPQGMVITRYGMERHPEQSRAFAAFLLSEAGQKIFKKYGYKGVMD